MALVDSAAAFEQRCQELDISGQLFQGLKLNGVVSFSTLAFSLGTPQSAPTDAQFEEVSQKVLVQW